jgi:PAS fold
MCGSDAVEVKHSLKLSTVWLKLGNGEDPRRFERPDYIKALLAAGVHASNLGISLMDSQTRNEFVNSALARESQASVNHHIGKTSREMVGDLASQIEPTYENVLRTGKPAFVRLVGIIRDTQETGSWLDYCFPIFDKSQRVQQIGMFVVNTTAERASTEIFSALSTDSKFLRARSTGLLERFDESVRGYHANLKTSFRKLADPSSDASRKNDGFRSSVEQLDHDIQLMRELIYAVIDQFLIPQC